MHRGEESVFEDFLQVCEVGRGNLLQRQIFEVGLQVPQSLLAFQPQVLIPRETLLNQRELTKLEEYLLTFAFDLADSLGPNLATNALSTAFLTSRGFAQRSSGEFLSALTTGPRLGHPAMSIEATWASTKAYNSSGAMLKSKQTVVSHRSTVDPTGIPTPHSLLKSLSSIGSLPDSMYFTAAQNPINQSLS